MITGTLTPEGARLLRAARVHFLAHPDEFNMANWCGTARCIAGHVCWQAGEREWDRCSGWRAAELLGFGPVVIHPTKDQDHPLTHLFYFSMEATPQEGAEAINAFLWKYGYPPDEIAGPIQEKEIDADTPHALALAVTS